MRKFSSIIKENAAVLAITLIVALLAGINIMLPDKKGAFEEPDGEAYDSKNSAEEINDSDADAIVISEFMIKNRAVIQDEDGDFSDYIELLNVSDRDIDLSGWSISDKTDKEGWTLPETVLPSGERLIIFASGKDKGLHTDFSLSEGETICLYSKTGLRAAEVSCPESENNTAFCLTENGSYEASLYPTPGYGSDDYDELQEKLSCDSPLIINEVQTAKLDPSGVENPENHDWAELKNMSAEAVMLSDYSLSDDNDDYLKWQLPDIELMPGEIITVYCDENPQDEPDSRVFCTAFSLNSASEQLYLSKNGEPVDFVSLRDIPYLCSYGRVSGENGWFYMSEPTEGEENRQGFRRVSRTPQVISGDGVSEGVESVSVEIKARGKIYYTTDGSLPTEESSPYTAPVKMSETGIIRAIAVESGAMPSRVLDISCIINEGHSLPVMSLVSYKPEQFNTMYDGGMKGVELPGSLSLYEEDSRFNIPCGIKIHGETSRVLPKKNMSVRFRGAYGQESLKYDVYGGGVTEFTNFVLRSGQDFYSAIIRNELCQNLSLQASDSLISQRSKYCVLYINGRYSGIYALMEKPNEQHYASLAGVSRDSVTVIESEAGYGSEVYEDIILFCMRNDMTQKENYERLKKVLDIDSLIDWVIMEGYCGNLDLTFGNLRYCRSTENDGRWRLMFYDLDSTFYDEGHCFDVLSDFALSTRQVSEIIKPLMENEEFRDSFLSRAGELLKGLLSPENVLSELDRLAAEIAPEVERDYERFEMGLDKWEWNVDFIRNLLKEGKWNELAVEKLCEAFHVDDAGRKEYFG